MPLKTLFIFSLSLPYAAHSGGGPKPTKPLELDCNDPSIVLPKRDEPYRNPMKERYRPSVDLPNALNKKFYAVQEGRISTNRATGEEFAEIPVYSWFERQEGFDTYTYFQRMDYFDMCGMYLGSNCVPIPYQQERIRYVPLKKWVPRIQVCRELDNPYNAPDLKQKILYEIARGNLYGLEETKGTSQDRDIVFLDRFKVYMQFEEDEGENNSSYERTPYNNRSRDSFEEEEYPQSSYDRYNRESDFDSRDSYTNEGNARISREPYLRNSEERPLEEAPQDSNFAPPSRNNRNLENQEETEEFIPVEPAPKAETRPTPSQQQRIPPPPIPVEKKAPGSPSIESTPTAPPPPPPTVLSDNPPEAKKVPNKPGFVYDPFLNDGSMIDVRGLPPHATKAKHPTTNQVFLLPQ